jgi:uncharacterized membrane protein YvbJ
MLKFCPGCGSSVQEKMPFCTNCGSALDYSGTQEDIPVKPDPDKLKKGGRKTQYLLIATIY